MLGTLCSADARTRLPGTEKCRFLLRSPRWPARCCPVPGQRLPRQPVASCGCLRPVVGAGPHSRISNRAASRPPPPWPSGAGLLGATALVHRQPRCVRPWQDDDVRRTIVYLRQTRPAATRSHHLHGRAGGSISSPPRPNSVVSRREVGSDVLTFASDGLKSGTRAGPRRDPCRRNSEIGKRAPMMGVWSAAEAGHPGLHQPAHQATPRRPPVASPIWHSLRMLQKDVQQAQLGDELAGRSSASGCCRGAERGDSVTLALEVLVEHLPDRQRCHLALASMESVSQLPAGVRGGTRGWRAWTAIGPTTAAGGEDYARGRRTGRPQGQRR